MLFVEYVVKGFQIVGADEVNVLFDEKAFELWSIGCAPPTEKFPFIMSLLDYVAHLLQLVGWNRFIAFLCEEFAVVVADDRHH